MTKQEFLTLTPGTIVGVKQRRAKLLNIYSTDRGLGYFAYLPTNRKVMKSYRQVHLIDPTKANTAKEFSKLSTEELVQIRSLQKRQDEVNAIWPDTGEV